MRRRLSRARRPFAPAATRRALAESLRRAEEQLRRLEEESAERERELAELRTIVERLGSDDDVVARYRAERGSRADLAAELDALDGAVNHLAHRLDRSDARGASLGHIGGNGANGNGHDDPAARRLTFVTSVSPVDLDRQERAIRSWLPYGDVVSINGREEASGIATRLRRRSGSPLLDVEFAIVDETAVREVGKPCVYLDGILDHIGAVGAHDRAFVIANSDIHVRFDGLVADETSTGPLLELLESGPIFGSRVEVDADDLEPLADASTTAAGWTRADGTYVWGFDYFVVTADHVAPVERSRFVFGQPWWDFYLPTELLRHHPRLFHLENHIALHVYHPARWNNANFDLFAQRYADHRRGGRQGARRLDAADVCREIRRHATRMRLPTGRPDPMPDRSRPSRADQTVSSR